jgi:hypothetical protein
MVIPATAGALDIVFSMAAILPWMILLVLVARNLFQLHQEPSQSERTEPT